PSVAIVELRARSRRSVTHHVMLSHDAVDSVEPPRLGQGVACATWMAAAPNERNVRTASAAGHAERVMAPGKPPSRCPMAVESTTMPVHRAAPSPNETGRKRWWHAACRYPTKS